MRSRSGRQTHSDRLSEDEAQRAVRPSCPAEEAIHSDHQTSVQRVKRSTSTARPVSSDRSDQLRFARPVSSGRRAYHSNRRTGPRTKDRGQLHRFGPRCLRRTNVNSASAAFPRGRPGESESSSGHAHATGITHPGFYGRKPWKKPNSAVIITVQRTAKEGLQHPFRRLPPNRSLKLTANPPHSRPGYRPHSPKVRRPSSSAFRRALRVSKSAVLRQLI